MSNYYFSIDVGGTFIKAGIVSENGDILFSDKLKVDVSEPNFLFDSIMKLIHNLETQSGLKIQKSCGLGIGFPGLTNSQTGVLGFSGNLNTKNYPLKQKLEQVFDIPIKIANDADVATLAELYYGAGKGIKNFVMATIGTGIGSGLIVNGKLISDFAPFAGEIGHIKITEKKIKCTCGEYGCFEAVASTKALVEMTKLAMKKHPESEMWKTYNLSTANGKTVFDYKDSDATAREVFDKFIENLGSGLVSIANIFMPELIILGGAISNQKDNLIVPLEKYINSHIYAKNIGGKIKLAVAKHTGDAGILGGRCLFFN